MTTLLVAATGGHLNELARLAPRFTPLDDDLVWVTDSTVQSRSLLDGARIEFVPPLDSRDVRGTLATTGHALRILRRHRPDRVVSTGSAIAVAFLPVARALGIPCHYIESGTRVSGPSTTGQILQYVPGVRRYTQHRSWTSPRWHYAGSILDGFEPHPTGSEPEPRRVVVTLGSWRQSFRRLVEHLVPLLPTTADVVWQTGHTDVTGLVDDPTPWLDAATLARAIAGADLVVTHAGMGATLDALDAGRCPVVVPRRQAHGEQIDDHQVQLADELARRELAVVRTPEALTAADLRTATARRIARSNHPRPFRLANH